MRRVSAALYAFTESQSPDWRKPDQRIQTNWRKRTNRLSFVNLQLYHKPAATLLQSE